MIEKSVLTQETLIEELKKRYGFKSVSKLSKIHRASANIFKIFCDNLYYILKEYQSSYRLEDILKEEKIILLLKENNIPAPDMVYCLNGDYAWEYNGRIFVLQKFSEGEVKPSFTGSEEQILESASYLSKINLILKNFKLAKENNIKTWFSLEKQEKTQTRYNQIIEECNKHNELIFKKIKQDILLKKNLLAEFLTNKKILSLLPQVSHMNSHGDYSVLQFIYSNDKIKTILDLSVAVKLPIVWEIIRSYSYIDPKCKEGKIDINTLKKYIKEYIKTVKLTKIDLEMIPYVYLIQLLNSAFGYTEYVLKNSENKEELLDFAFWRTKMCKWLFNNAEQLSKELERSFTGTF